MNQRLYIELDPTAILRLFIELDSFRFCPPLSLWPFERLANEADLNTRRDLLERLEQLGLFRPLFHVRFPRPRERYIWPDFRYHDIAAWLDHGHLVPSTPETYKPWSDFRDQGRTTAQPYYSCFQLYTLHARISNLGLTVNALWLAGMTPEDAGKWFERRQKWAAETLEYAAEVQTPHFDTVIVCQAIASRYFFPTQTDGRTISVSDPESPKKPNWYEYCRAWDPQRALKLLGLRIDEIREYHKIVSAAASFLDPLADWYDLVSLVAVEAKKRLKGAAFLAQVFYSMEHMLRLFYEDLTGDKLEPPGGNPSYQLPDGTAETLEVGTVRSLRYVVNRYHLNPQPQLVLFVEGASESEALPRLAERLFGVTFEHCGIEIRSLGGVQNFEGPKGQLYGNLARVIEELHARQTVTFVVLDNEGRSRHSLISLRERLATTPSQYRPTRTITRREFIQIWRRSFEADNFSLEEIATGLTVTADGRYKFTPHEVEETLASTEGGNPLNRLYESKLSYGLRKVKLAAALCDLIPAEEPCEGRPLLVILRAILHLAVLNHQPTLEADDRENQISGYLGHPIIGPDPAEDDFKHLRDLQER